MAGVRAETFKLLEVIYYVERERREYKVRKNLLWISFIALLILSVLTGFSVNTLKVSAVEYPAIMVVPENVIDENLKLGENFTVSIYTDYTGNDVWSYEFSLTFNPNVLGGINVTNGDLITKEKDPSAQFLPGDFNNTKGELSLTGAVFIFIFPPAPLTSGPGILANVTFTVVGYGTSDITIGDDTRLIGIKDGGSGVKYDIINAKRDFDHIQHGFFSNKILGDVNGDGIVDASDLFDLGKAYGSSLGDLNWNSDCDFNRDDKVDDLDLSDLNENFGRSVP